MTEDVIPSAMKHAVLCAMHAFVHMTISSKVFMALDYPIWLHLYHVLSMYI